MGLFSAIFTTNDGSTYNYSGWGLNVDGGYSWYFENDLSVILGICPAYGTASKQSEN